MAPINTLQDISRALRENPEWREEIRRALLSAELIALPETHAALTAEVREIAVGMNALTARVDALTTEARALTAKVDAFVEATNRRLDSLEEGQRRLEKRMDGMQYRLDQLWGDRLEAKLPNRLSTPVRREFNVRRLRSVWAGNRVITGDRNPKFIDDVDAAADAGKITENEESRLTDADLIMRALRNSNGATVWFAVEASGVINTDDIERARQSADAITKVYAQDAIPLVYGYRISDHQRRQASEHAVHVFIDPDGD